jgi:hypothetical protein
MYLRVEDVLLERNDKEKRWRLILMSGKDRRVREV